MAWISDNYGFEEEADLFLQKVSIHQLSPELSQVIIIGVIIAKQDVRRIVSKKQPGSDRCVLNFTLRDSSTDTINAMCWGEETNVRNLSSNFTIGDVVKIKNPQIIERLTEQDDKFRPPASSQFLLNISPSYSQIITCDEDQSQYKQLLHCPLHSASETISLADVIYNSQNADGLNLNMLVAIKDIKPLQNMKTKNGKELKKLQFSVFDETHHTFPVITWDEETANFILKYCSKRSVLFISDIKVSYNAFMKEMAATASSTTIFTPEPDVPEKRVLYQYAMKMVAANDKNGIKQIDSTKLCAINEINRVMDATELEAGEIEGTAHAVLTTFNIDGPPSTILSLRCPGCYGLLQNTDDKCTNGACEIGSGMKFLPPEEMYDITISLTDETGNQDRCRLGEQVAENLLGLKAKDFISLSSEKKTALKWAFLFERFTVHFKISQSSTGNGKAFLKVIQMKKDI